MIGSCGGFHHIGKDVPASGLVDYMRVMVIGQGAGWKLPGYRGKSLQDSPISIETHSQFRQVRKQVEPILKPARLATHLPGLDVAPGRFFQCLQFAFARNASAFGCNLLVAMFF